MKVAELERATGVPRSTLHHYLNLGLLPPPAVLGPKLHLYGEEHLNRVREIGRLRAAGHSLDRIRARLARRRVRPFSPKGAQPPKKNSGQGDGTSAVRADILDAAVRLFMERGYDDVHVGDVARAAGIGKATLYQYFGSKADLFVDCLDRLGETAASLDIHSLLHDPSAVQTEDELRAAEVITRFESYRMIVSALAPAAYGKDPVVAARARAAFRKVARSAEPWLRRAIDEGRCRPMDPEMLAYMTWGALMAVGARLALGDGQYTLDQALGIYLDFVTNGTKLRKA